MIHFAVLKLNAPQRQVEDKLKSLVGVASLVEALGGKEKVKTMFAGKLMATLHDQIDKRVTALETEEKAKTTSGVDTAEFENPMGELFENASDDVEKGKKKTGGKGKKKTGGKGKKK